MSKGTIVSFTVLLAALGMRAAFAQSLPATLDACTRIAADTARLQCFDREAAALSQHERSSRQPSQKAADAPAPSAVAAAPLLTPEQKFGLTTEKIQRQEEARGAVAAQPPSTTRVQTRVLQVSGGGRALFMLENGQTWRQTESQSSFSLRPGDEVTLTKGAMGSFWISTGPHNSARVERVR